MSGKRVLVTGATGFIGQQLVRRLIQTGHHVTAMVRRSSRVVELKRLDVQLVCADFSDPQSLQVAVDGQDVVYHLAAVARAVSRRDFQRVNEMGLANLLRACVASQRYSEGSSQVFSGADVSSCQTSIVGIPIGDSAADEVSRSDEASRSKRPRVVLVSSLAAVGPCAAHAPHRESVIPRPVSVYGKSKLSAERIARKFSDQLHISTVRPPIVLGSGDRRGLTMFKTVDALGMQLVPGRADQTCSVIHVADLADALIAVANRGSLMTTHDREAGVYFAAADEVLTMRQLAVMVGEALGKSKTVVLRVPAAVLKVIGTFNTALGFVRNRPLFLNYDKTRDMAAGSWACENRKLKTEVGFVFPVSLRDRIDQTVRGYRRQGWLKPSGINAVGRAEGLASATRPTVSHPPSSATSPRR